MTTGLGAKILQDVEEMEYLLSFFIAAVELRPRNYVGGEPGHVLADLKLSPTRPDLALQCLEHLLSAFHHVPRIALLKNQKTKNK